MIGVSAVMIFVYSLETLLVTKDAILYQQALENGIVNDLETYVSLQMMQYLMHIAVPALFAIYIFFSGRRTSRMARAVITVLLLAGAVFRALDGRLTSPFYYVSLTLYLVLILWLNRPQKTPASEAQR